MKHVITSYSIHYTKLYDGRRMREDKNSNTGKAMPEFPGYNGPANPELPVIKVKAVRNNFV